MDTSKLADLAGFTFFVSIFTGGQMAIAQNVAPVFQVCHGFDCHYKTEVPLLPDDIAVLHRLFKHIADSHSERETIKKSNLF